MPSSYGYKYESTNMVIEIDRIYLSLRSITGLGRSHYQGRRSYAWGPPRPMICESCANFRTNWATLDVIKPRRYTQICLGSRVYVAEVGRSLSRGLRITLPHVRFCSKSWECNGSSSFCEPQVLYGWYRSASITTAVPNSVHLLDFFISTTT